MRQKLRAMGTPDAGLSQEKRLEAVIKITYKSFYWIFLFLMLASIAKYIFWDKIGIAVDVAIIIGFIWLFKIKRAMEKKEKEGPHRS